MSLEAREGEKLTDVMTATVSSSSSSIRLMISGTASSFDWDFQVEGGVGLWKELEK